MKHKILIVEGTDGSGKSTICKGINGSLSQRSISSKIISKNSSDLLNQITLTYQKFGNQSDNFSECLLRIAREYEKIIFDFDGVKILDRSLISLRTTLKLAGCDFPRFETMLISMENLLKSSPTIFCRPSYNVARSRVEKRAEDGEILSAKELRGREYNLQVYETIVSEADAWSSRGHSLLSIDTGSVSETTAISMAMNFFEEGQ